MVRLNKKTFLILSVLAGVGFIVKNYYLFAADAAAINLVPMSSDKVGSLAKNYYQLMAVLFSIQNGKFVCDYRGTRSAENPSGKDATTLANNLAWFTSADKKVNPNAITAKQLSDLIVGMQILERSFITPHAYPDSNGQYPANLSPAPGTYGYPLPLGSVNKADADAIRNVQSTPFGQDTIRKWVNGSKNVQSLFDALFKKVFVLNQGSSTQGTVAGYLMQDITSIDNLKTFLDNNLATIKALGYQAVDISASMFNTAKQRGSSGINIPGANNNKPRV